MKLCDMQGVRGGERGYAVELWRTDEGRLVVRAYNEAGYSYTDVDLWDILSWVSIGPDACPDRAPPFRDGASGY